MNTELIKALRNCSSPRVDSCIDCPYYKDVSCKWQMMEDAAAALKAADKRIAELEAQLPKEGEWIWENYYWHCSACGENPTRGMGYVQGRNELFRVCPNCGAKMKTVTDCHALEEENDEQ